MEIFQTGLVYVKHKTNELALPRRLSNRKHQRMMYLQFFHHRAYGTNKKRISVVPFHYSSFLKY